MAKGNFDENIRQSMRPKTPARDARADGAGKDQAATGKESKPISVEQPPPAAVNAAVHPQIPEGLPPHLAAAASIAHAIINNRPAK